MKTMVFATGSLLMALVGGSAQAQAFQVQGTGATGQPGERVYVQLVYDYGASFAAIAEDLQFEYQFTGMTFMPDASTIDVAGAAQSLLVYTDALRQFAQDHQGSVLINPNVVGSKPDYQGYALSFYTADGTPHGRRGQVNLRMAFDILADAKPGVYGVSFTDINVLVDEEGSEYGYPSALRNLGVTVVPEPSVAGLLLPGLAVVGLRARRRAGLRRL